MYFYSILMMNFGKSVKKKVSKKPQLYFTKNHKKLYFVYSNIYEILILISLRPKSDCLHCIFTVFITVTSVALLIKRKLFDNILL